RSDSAVVCGIGCGNENCPWVGLLIALPVRRRGPPNNLMTNDEAQKIANGIAKLPELLKRPQHIGVPNSPAPRRLNGLMPSPTRVTTRSRCKPILATTTSSTPCAYTELSPTRFKNFWRE